MRSRTLLGILAVVLTALLAQGCGITDPLNEPTVRDGQATVQRVVGPNLNEVPTPPVDVRTLRTLGARATTPAEAVVRFACGYTNWTYRNIAAVRRRLASSSIGAAANEQRRAAAEIAQDTELRRGRVENSGQVVSPEARGAAPNACRPAPSIDPGFRRFVVVTLERTTTAGGDAGAQRAYHVTLATVAHLRSGGWAVSSWRPQN